MKAFLRLWLSLIFLLVSNSFVFAQNEKGQIIISGGVGYSPGFDGQITFFNSQDYPTEMAGTWGGDTYGFSCYSILPNLGLTADYGLLDKLSLGIAASYQSELVNWSPDFVNASNGYWTDKITRINIATRILFHLNKHNQSFDPYIGLRPGFCYWIDNPQNNEINYGYGTIYTTQRFSNFLSNTNYFKFSMQVLYGMRIYTSDHVALNFEFAIGQPFLLEGGLSYRINSKKKVQNTPAPVNFGGHPAK